MPALPATPPRADLPAKAGRGERLFAACLAAGSLAVLCIAASLDPDPRGVETHTQLGLWPCGWYLATGYPCPTCGMTTAFAAAAGGSYLASLKTQPFGAVLALATAATFWGGLHVALLGSRLGTIGGKLLRPRPIMIGTGLLALSWIYKALVMRG